MDLPTNHFKRAIKSGQQQIGFWCSLASHISAEMLSGSGFDWLLLDTEHSPNEIPMVLQPAAGGGVRRTGAPDRAHPLERHGGDQALPRRRRPDAADPQRADRRGSEAGGRGNPLSAARRARLRLGITIVPVRADQGLPHALSRGDLRRVADRDAARARKPRGNRPRRGGRRASSSVRATCRPTSAMSATRVIRR